MTDFIQPSAQIADVRVVNLRPFADARGVFLEVFRREWFPDTDWTRLQSNCSHSKAHVLRGLHYHKHQVDYWYVPHGRIRAALVDLRAGSPSYLRSEIVELGETVARGLYIPVGVAHGFVALTDCTLLYYVNNYYDGGDEFGVAWNDAALGVDWGVSDPIISERDQGNPTLNAIPAPDRPT